MPTDGTCASAHKTRRSPATLKTTIGISRARATALIVVNLALAGCVLIDPYTHTAQPSDSTGPCTHVADAAVAYACDRRADIESSREQLAYSQNGLASVLMATVGVVGYKTARHGSSASGAAFAAGGLGLYGLGQYLIQPSRFTLYDRAVAALSCALDLHGRTAQSQPLSIEMLTYQAARQAALDAIDQARKDALSGVQNQLDQAGSALAILDQAVQARSPARLLDRQLIGATDRIIGELNAGITTTSLPITALGQQLNQLAPAPSPTQAKAPQGVAAGEEAWSKAVKAAFDAGNVILMASGGPAPLSADFAICTIGVITLAPTPLQTPLQLSSGGVSIENTTVPVTATDPAVIAVTGGQVPYTTSVVDASGSSASALPTAVVSQVGAAYIVTVKKAMATTGTYTVVVADSAQTVRKFKVSIP